MKRAAVILAWGGIFFLVASQAVGAGIEARITAISHRMADGGEFIDIVLDEDVSPRAFVIDGKKPRFVIDVPASTYTGKTMIIATPNSHFLQRLRVGIHNKPVVKTRLVADLVSGQPFDWHQEYHPETGILTFALQAAKEMDSGVPKTNSIPDRSSADQSSAQQSSAEGEKEPPVSSVPSDPPGRETLKTIPTVKPATGDTPPRERSQGTPTADEQPPPPQRSPPKPILTSVTFDNAFSQSGEMVLLQLSDFTPPKISTQESNPPRIFCDFTGAEMSEGLQEKIVADGSYVDTVRIVKEKELLRVVLDLVKGENYDVQQVYFKEDNLFVLIVNKLEKL